MFTDHLWALALGTVLLLTAQSPAGDKDTSGGPLPPGAKVRLGSPNHHIPKGLYYADLSPDGRAIGHLDVRDHLTLTDVRTGAVTTGHRLSMMPQARLVFAPDGKRFATTDQSAVAVWDTDTGQCLAEVQVRGAPRPQMWAPVAFSAGGKRLAVAWGRKGSALVYVVWDVDRNQLVTEVAAPGADRAFVALSPDGKRLVTWGCRDDAQPAAKPDRAGDPNRTITVWDADTGKPVHRIAVPGPAVGRRVCFRPDGKTLAVVGREIELWDTARWEVRARAKGRTGWWPVGNAVAFSPDGKRLAILDADGTVDLRDGATGDRVALVKGHAPGHTLRFTGNDQAVVLGGGEHVFCAWEVPSGDLLTPPPGHLDKVRQVVFTPDGRQLLSVSEDGALIRWDVTAGKPVAGGGMTPADYAGWVGTDELLEYVSPDGARAVFGRPHSGAVRVVDLQTRKERLTAARKFDMTWAPNVTCSLRGTRMLLNPGCRNGYPTDARPNTVWDMTSGRKLFDFPQQDSHLNRTFFSPDDRFLIVVGWRRRANSNQEGVAGQVRDGATGKQLAAFAAAGMWGDYTAGVSPDGRTLVVSSRGKQVSIFDLPGARRRLEAAPSMHIPQSPVVFSPDGRLFALGQGENCDGRGVVQVWETASGSIRHTFDGHALATPEVAFSPDGRLLASGSKDATVVLWDLGTAPTPPELRTAKPDLLWERLGHPDAAEAHPAILALISRPADAVAVIGKNLEPAPAVAVGPAEIKRLIARLDADDFQDREAATKALRDLGPDAEGLLKDALAAAPPLEVRRRLEGVLAAKAGPTRDQVRSARAVEVLERVGTAEARGLLRRLAGGRPGHPLTEDAKAALRRLEGKRGKKRRRRFPA